MAFVQKEALRIHPAVLWLPEHQVADNATYGLT